MRGDLLLAAAAAGSPRRPERYGSGVSTRSKRFYDSRWGWLLPSGISWKLGRKPSRRRAVLAAFINPLDFAMYREAEELSRRSDSDAD